MADRWPSLNTWQGGGVSGLCVRFGEGRGSYQMMGPPQSSWPTPAFGAYNG